VIATGEFPARFAALCANHAAAAAAGERTVRLSIAGRAVVLRFAGTAMHDAMAPAFAHLQAPADRAPAGRADLTILIWDGTPAPDAMPELARGAGSTAAACGRDWFAHYDGDSGLLTVVDRRAGIACVHARAVAGLQAMDRAHPLRRVISAWARDRGLVVVHGAAVGDAHNALLVAGPTGSGKSTTTLAWIAQGGRSAGDDCLVVEPESGVAHTLFATMRLHLDHAARFPGLLPAVDSVEQHVTGRDKATVNMARVRPQALIARQTLRGVVIPRVVGAGPSRLVPEAPARILRELLANNLSQFYDPSDPGLAGAIAALCRTRPCRRLEIGADPHDIPRVLGAWLVALAAGEAAAS